MTDEEAKKKDDEIGSKVGALIEEAGNLLEANKGYNGVRGLVAVFVDRRSAQVRIVGHAMALDAAFFKVSGEVLARQLK